MGKLVGNYRVNQKLTSPGTDTATITGPAVSNDRIAILTYMSIIDYTNNTNELMLGIIDAGGNEHMLAFELGTTTDVRQTCKIEGEIILLPGDRPFGRVLSPSTSDVIYFTAHGGEYREDQPNA